MSPKEHDSNNRAKEKETEALPQKKSINLIRQEHTDKSMKLERRQYEREIWQRDRGNLKGIKQKPQN